MSRGIVKAVKRASEKVGKEIFELSKGGYGVAAGLSSEGYAGGYRDALQDVLLLLNGVTPRRRDYWEVSPDITGHAPSR